jgi:hypothetical protein
MAPGSPATLTQSDTPWGRIWDGLPEGFPVFSGSQPGDDAVRGEATSGAFIIEGGDPATIASWYQAALENATFSTASMSGPLEDGGFTIESVGNGECRIQTRVVPKGGLVLVTVLYGSGCPAS